MAQFTNNNFTESLATRTASYLSSLCGDLPGRLSEVSSRADLRAYLGNKRFKDGLKRCETYLKKNPADVTLLLWRARFLRALARFSDADAVLDSISARDPPITDVAAIEQIDSYLHDTHLTTYPRPLTHGPRMIELWNNAVASSPNRTAPAIHKERFTACLLDRRWKDASTALQVWRKYCPDDRIVKYLHIACQIICSERDHDPTTAAISRSLAVKTLTTTAPNSVCELRTAVAVLFREAHDGTPADKTTLLPLMQVLQDKLLLSEWEFLRVGIEALAEMEQWESVKGLCSTMLGIGPNATPGLPTSDDWLVWQNYLRSCIETADGPDVDLAAILDPLPTKNTRNTALAGMRIAVLYKHKGWDPERAETLLLDRVRSFLVMNSGKAVCFHDLINVVPELNESSKPELLVMISDIESQDPKSHLTPESWVVSMATLLKLRFFLHELAPPPNPEPALHFLLKSVLQAEHARTLSTSSTSPDLLLLAAEILIRLYGHRPDRPSLLCRAAYLLEPLADIHVFQAQVALTYIYQTLAMPSLAISSYNKLKVRDTQNETFAHSLFTRLSLLHPSNHPIAQPSQPFEAADKIAKVLHRLADAEHQCFRYAADLHSSTRTDMLLDICSLRDRLDHSIVRRILILEQRRAARLTNRHVDDKVPVLEPVAFENWVKHLQDSRDWFTSVHTAPKTDAHPSIEKRLRGRHGIPDASWIHYTLFTDQIWSSIINSTSNTHHHHLSLHLHNNTSNNNTGTMPLLPPETPFPIPKQASLIPNSPEAALLPAWLCLANCLASPADAAKTSALLRAVKDIETAVAAGISATSRPTTTSTASNNRETPEALDPNVQLDLMLCFARLEFLKAVAAWSARCVSLLGSLSSGPINASNAAQTSTSASFAFATPAMVLDFSSETVGEIDAETGSENGTAAPTQAPRAPPPSSSLQKTSGPTSKSQSTQQQPQSTLATPFKALAQATARVFEALHHYARLKRDALHSHTGHPGHLLGHSRSSSSSASVSASASASALAASSAADISRALFAELVFARPNNAGSSSSLYLAPAPAATAPAPRAAAGNAGTAAAVPAIRVPTGTAGTAGTVTDTETDTGSVKASSNKAGKQPAPMSPMDTANTAPTPNTSNSTATTDMTDMANTANTVNTSATTDTSTTADSTGTTADTTETNTARIEVAATPDSWREEWRRITACTPVGERAIRFWCGEAVDSMREAWEGVLAVKLL